MPTLCEETAEAVCGGLHRSQEFTFLGETPSFDARATGLFAHGLVSGGLTTWWSSARKDYPLRVAVIRDEPFVRVGIEFPVRAREGRTLRGAIVVKIDAGPTMPRRGVEQAAADAVVRCLEVLRDVMQESGVANPNRVEAQRPQ